MTRYILRRGGRVLATALFTGAVFLGFVAPTAAGEFISWTGMFTPDGHCKVTAVDQSADILIFSGPVPAAPADTCSGIKSAIQKTAGRTTDPFLCVQEPTQSHIVPPPPLGLDSDLFRGGLDDFLPEQLEGRVFRVGITGEARCEPTSTTPPVADEFVLWTGVFTADGCKVTAVDQSAEILLFSDSVPDGADGTCSGIKAAIQKLGERQTEPIECTQQPTQSHIAAAVPMIGATFGRNGPAPTGDFNIEFTETGGLTTWFGMFTSDGGVVVAFMADIGDCSVTPPGDGCMYTDIIASIFFDGVALKIFVTVPAPGGFEILMVEQDGDWITLNPKDVSSPRFGTYVITPKDATPRLGLDDLFSSGEPREKLEGRIFRVGITGEARCELRNTTD